jgi:two-component sensor histidine kinase
MTLLDLLLDPSGLTAHGFCLSWNPGLIWLHVTSDAIIGLSYFSIPLALAWFVKQRPDIEYGWIIYLFVCFIMACGLTHIMAILTLWVPAYTADGLLKLTTAIASIVTALKLWPLVPRIVALPSPTQMSILNAELRSTIADHETARELLRASEERVVAANNELERRVAQRTADLQVSNDRLAEALAHQSAVEAELRRAKLELEGVVEERSAAVRQRDLLLREVYHRVKNNLQIVDSLLIMQASHIADGDAKQALLALRGRIYALGLVHQQLMTSADLQTFDIAPFLHELTGNISRGGADGDITVTIDACRLAVDLDFAIPLGMLVTELLTNSLRHAFPSRRGVVRVSLMHGEAGTVLLRVQDDGQGKTIDRGDDQSTSGLGSHIIRGLVDQLNGQMDTYSDAGTRTDISIPIPELAVA